MSIKTRRQSRLRMLLEQRRPRSQEELAALLRREGIEATQATLSRDLRELGVLKGPEGYTLPQAQPAAGGHELREAAGAYLISAKAAANFVVVRTGPGQASALALQIDHAGLDGMVGTVAGDDTIFVAAKSARDAARLARSLEELAGRS
jgi:transcriptional regulator of arginine metabolism